MIRFDDVPFGPTNATVEAPDLQSALDEMGKLTRLHQDARMLEAHVRFFYDADPLVVPTARIDDEGYRYRGFRCLNTGCSITFKEQEGGQIWPGRYRAYRNGDDRPKLYDPTYSYEEILAAIGPETEYIRRFGVDVGEHAADRGRPPQQGPPQQRAPQQPPPQGTRPDEDDRVPAGEHSGRQGRPESGPQNGEKSWPQKVQEVRARLKAAALAERPGLIARLEEWATQLPDGKEADVREVVSEYRADEAYDARLEELEELAAGAADDRRHETLEKIANEVQRWPKTYREAARIALSGHAPEDYDLPGAIH